MEGDGKGKEDDGMFNFNIDVIYTFRGSVNKCELREIARDYQFSSRVHSVKPYSPHEHSKTGPADPGIIFFTKDGIGEQWLQYVLLRR